ncbi:TetR/AcrR family transcriptional regulator [Devosia aurantiaca]|uniref:TetR/AcrR family transcriptional regulator n=1 Tax=Devosia aurantiaca TaxID=2714858 RepID=A0A6M1SRK9_9HYPH|nr:TetR family transcriptional regulator [Devosia aurantiaca]NGP17013.1 TetR/AcrR family transcriptional regulator [Devosia aurantiaca]
MRDAIATQERLLLAARRRFADQGFELTTVREIADDAGVNVALISRYFGGKEDLFARAVAIDLQLPDLSAVPQEQIGARLVEHFFRRWEGEPADDLLRVLVRTAATHPAAAARVADIFDSQVRPLVAMLAGDGEAAQRASLVATQVLGLAYCRYVLSLKSNELTRASTHRMIGETIQRYLFAPLAA